jgi:hypothetical protein
MANEIKILHEVKKCPACGSMVTVSYLGCADAKAKGKIKPDAFTCLEQLPTPLEQPMLAGVMIDAILVCYDVCAQCGTQYSTRSQLIKVPVSAQIAGSNRHDRRHPTNLERG